MQLCQKVQTTKPFGCKYTVYHTNVTQFELQEQQETDYTWL